MRDGDELVLNGHKWFTSNGNAADFFIVMTRVVDADHDPATGGGQMAQLIVPTDTPGVNIVRGVGIWGRPTSDHVEVRYENVRVPAANLLGAVGQGHQAAQDRLGAVPDGDATDVDGAHSVIPLCRSIRTVKGADKRIIMAAKGAAPA